MLNSITYPYITAEYYIVQIMKSQNTPQFLALMPKSWDGFCSVLCRNGTARYRERIAVGHGTVTMYTWVDATQIKGNQHRLLADPPPEPMYNH